MARAKGLKHNDELERIDDQLALLDRWYTSIINDDVGYDGTLVGDVATKLLSDIAIVVDLRNGLRLRRREVLGWTEEEERELVELPNDPLLVGWLYRDEASMEQLDALAKEQSVPVPELLVKRLRQAPAKETTSV